MIASAFYQENGTKRSQNRSGNQHDHSTVERDSFSISGVRLRANGCQESSSKRFKPNTNGPRTRISFDGAEEAFRRDCPNKSSTFGSQKAGPSQTQGQTSVNSVPPNVDSEHGNQTGAGTVDDEESDEDGSQPQLGSQHNNLKFNPSLYSGDLQRSESVSTASTLASPLTTAMKSNEVAGDLSLGHDDSIGSCEARPGTDPQISLSSQERIGSKIQTKLIHKTFAKDPAEFDEVYFLASIKNAAAEKGFTCLSTKCPTRDTCLTFTCAEGHMISSKEFATTRVISCPKCEKYLERCIEHAKAHNGSPPLFD